MEVRLLPPALKEQINTPEYQLLVVASGSEPEARRFDSCLRCCGRPVLVQELGCEPSLCRFNSDRSPFNNEALESIWWWSLTVDQVVASSILVKGAYSYGRHPAGLGRCLENSWR